uniref:Uncharacterized protein n=1 Tax=Lepeophtheirus salmonis TaxID=72036 RepID=A0A0K2VHV1_LEPSM
MRWSIIVRRGNLDSILATHNQKTRGYTWTPKLIYCGLGKSFNTIKSILIS